MNEDTRSLHPEQPPAVGPRPEARGDPAPLGLAGFALTTLMLSIVNTDLLKEAGAIVPVLGLAAFYGGVAQFAAGLFEFRRGNTFGATTFCSYGAFWLSYWWIAPRLAFAGNTHNALGLFLLGWAIFTAFMAVAALRVNLGVLAMLALLTLTYLFLAIGAFQTGPQPHAMTQVGGWFGILTGLAAWYTAAATMINDTHRRTLLPVGERRPGVARPAGDERPA
ncbi:Succinate-acetate/proton symporter SatP [Streptomyces sp. RB17]|uniref:acetate uptake transporter n=1 Tax=Streptomyces sp. RB17 TaxID=2585197 RepID=UPI001296D78A|nr:GPR1/FUN34/YaaH family transporter [Streptomyces sp. RB17]MQY34486.1 Succinate-acetate/proton symporter SatP [Streptomyces sp. RB17]